MAIIKKKFLFKGSKARPEVLRQGVRSELGTFVYDLGVVASTPSDRVITIGASSFYLHQDLIDFPETAVNLGSGTYQTSAFSVGQVRRVLFSIDQAGLLKMYQGLPVIPPAVPVNPTLPQKERPVCLLTVTSAVNTPGGIQSVAQSDIIQLNFADQRVSSHVVDAYADLAALVDPQHGDVVFVSDRAEFYFYNGNATAWQRVGNATNGRVDVSLGASSITINFAQPMRTVDYVAMPCFFNDTDAVVQYQPMVIVEQTLNGFTVSWNAPTDSDNYKVQYVTSVLV